MITPLKNFDLKQNFLRVNALTDNLTVRTLLCRPVTIFFSALPTLG